MSLELFFTFANYAVLPFWALLMLAPKWQWTQRLSHGPIIVLLLAPLYAYLLFFHGESPEGTGFQSLYGVMAAFSAPHIVLAGWIHYLIFDLFIGAWQVRDSLRLSIPHWFVFPCLVLTLLAGPVGLMLYVILRFVVRKKIEFHEN